MTKLSTKKLFILVSLCLYSSAFCSDLNAGNDAYLKAPDLKQHTLRNAFLDDTEFLSKQQKATVVNETMADITDDVAKKNSLIKACGLAFITLTNCGLIYWFCDTGKKRAIVTGWVLMLTYALSDLFECIDKRWGIVVSLSRLEESKFI